MLLKDSEQRVFPEDPWSRKPRFGHSVFKFCEAWCIPGSQFHEIVGNATPPKTESQDAYKPVASLKNLATHIGKLTSNTVMAFQKQEWPLSAGESWKSQQKWRL